MFLYFSVVLPLLRVSLSFLSRLPGMDPCLSQVGYMGRTAFFQSRHALLLLQRRVSVEEDPWFWLIHLIIRPQMWEAMSSRHAWHPDQASPAGLADRAWTRPDGRTLSLCLGESSQDGSGPALRVHTCTAVFSFNHNQSLLEALSPPLCGHKWNPCLGQ